MASVDTRTLRRGRPPGAASSVSAYPGPVAPAVENSVGETAVDSVSGGGGVEPRSWPMGDPPRESSLTQYLPERWQGARLDPGSRGLLALCGIGAVVVLVAAWAVFRDAPVVAPVPALPVVSPQSSESADSNESTDSTTAFDAGDSPALADEPAFIVVSVVGLVSSSGIVHLPHDSRIADALEAAGGPLAGADVLALNLAAKLQDGDQIVVGSMPVEGRPTVSTTMKDDGIGGSSTTSGPLDESDSLVDLNSATVEILDTLAGVGPVTAASIVAWRESNGPFTDVAQLAEVDGIGPVRFEKLRTQVTV